SRSVPTYYAYCMQLLYAGHTERCIMELEGLLQNIEASELKKDEKSALDLMKLKALAYLRMGEQENCFAGNPDACLIPVTASNLYDKKASTRQAIQTYEQILRQFPKDKEAIWLLNIAHMVIGSHPDKVPEQWRIEPDKFESSKVIEKFHNVAHEAGVDVLGLAGGIAFDDFNNDGFADILTATSDPAQSVQYFQNRGDGTFEDRTQAAKLDQVVGGLNMTHADYNNDGNLDVLILRGAWDRKYGKIPNSLLRNNGDGTFTDVTLEANIYSEKPTQTAAWADLNRDGWLDLLIANESAEDENNACELFINQQDGTFVDYAEMLGLAQHVGYFKGCTIGDVNNDGWADIYLSDYNGKNLLCLHNGASDLDNMKFEVVSNRVGVSKPARSFPTWMFDLNNDGWLDIFVASYGDPNRSRLEKVADCYLSDCNKNLCPHIYLNKQDGTFENIAPALGLNKIDLTMGCNYGDLNMDGHLDLFLATGDPDYSTVVPNKVYLYEANYFYDVTTSGGFGNIQKGHAVGFADFDHDGDEDIYCVLGGVYEGDVFRNALYQNPIAKTQWLGLDLVGTKTNRSAIGTRFCLNVKKKDGTAQKIYRTIGGGSSFGGNSLREIIGLQDVESIDSLEIDWGAKDSKRQTFSNVAMNQLLQIT
ncbi:MAG: CRTAC1 family protein, partial [Bacteroidota bacterium]